MASHMVSNVSIDDICYEKFSCNYSSLKQNEHYRQKVRRLIMHLWVDRKMDIPAITELMGFAKNDTVFKYISQPDISWKPDDAQILKIKKYLKIDHV